jgi:hypothetical protein
MKTWQRVKLKLKKKAPLACLWHDCDSALISTARIRREKDWVTVAVYDYESLVYHFYEDFKITSEDEEFDIYEQAVDFVHFNIIGAYIGKRTPIYWSDGKNYNPW